MEDRKYRCSRRKFLASAAALTLSGGVGAGSDQTPGDAGDSFRTRPAKLSNQGRKPIAVITTVYRPLSHAYHLAGRFLYGYARDGKHHVPGFHVASLCVDQTPDTDLSRDLAREHGFRLTRSIEDALTLGSGKLAVCGVLLVAEHGNYARNERGQILYPRHEMFEQIVKVFRDTCKAAPVFNDKHLSYSWPKAQEMVSWARELRFPFMAGSSLPVTWRRPELELPLQTEFEDALVAGFGPIEVHGFHGLEALQAMVERRRGGEVGVKAVTCLTGNDVWKAGDAGIWRWDLLEAALGRSETLNPGDVRVNTGSMPVGSMPRTPPTAFILEYLDGFRATLLLLNGHIQDFCFAARIKGEPKPASCLFCLPAPPGAKYFDCQVANIEKLFTSGVAPSPVERTLLTSGILAAAMESHHQRGNRVETPHLDVRYLAMPDSGLVRGSIASLI